MTFVQDALQKDTYLNLLHQHRKDQILVQPVVTLLDIQTGAHI